MSDRNGWMWGAGVLALGVIVWLLPVWQESSVVDSIDEPPPAERTPNPVLNAGAEARPAEPTKAEAESGDAPPPHEEAESPRLQGTVRMRGREKPPPMSVSLLRKGVEPKNRGDPENRIKFETRADGHFAGGVAGLRLTDFWLVVDPNHMAGALPQFVDGATLRPGEPLDIELQPGRRIHVEVVDEAGRPVERAQIGLVPLRAEEIHTYPYPGEPTMGTWSLPMAEGENIRVFSLPFAGALRVSARKQGYARRHTIIGAGVEEVVLQLVKPESMIRVTLLNAAEWKNAMAFLELHDERYGRWPPRIGQRGFEDGVATFENVAGPGVHRVKLTSWDAETTILGPIRVTKTQRLHRVEGRLERREGFGRLVVVCDVAALGVPRVWIRLPGKDWELFMLTFSHPDGRDIRSLPVGTVDVVLAAQDGSSIAHVLGAKIEDRADTRTTPAWRAVRRFTVPPADTEAGQFTLPGGPIARAWIELGSGEPFPLLWLGKGIRGAAPDLRPAQHAVASHARFLVPSETATLWIESKNGEKANLPLLPSDD